MTELTGSATCRICGSGEIETDYNQGQSFCASCGVVQEDELITNTVQHETGASGHNTLVGRNVNLDTDGYIGQTGNPLKGGIAKSSRDSTLSKNEDRLRGLATRSNCGPDVCSHGFRVYKMAYDAGMTRKRSIDTLLSSCLYIASRRLKTGHMLADFLPVLQGDIYDLAKTVRYLITRLCIAVPMQDPIMQVERFCHELISDKTLVPKVVNLSHRIVERMKKDWIDAGRKPAGVAAAAVIIACRINDHELDLDEVSRVSQVASVTIRRRLIEFARTESGKLLPSEFETEDLPRALHHPAVFSNRKIKTSAPWQIGPSERREIAVCLKALLVTILTVLEEDEHGVRRYDIDEEDMDDLKHSLITLLTSIELLESRWKLTVEKSLFIATDLKFAITDEEFETGKNIVCREYLEALMCNEAEQEIRRENLGHKFGGVLERRAGKKRELQEEEEAGGVRHKRTYTKRKGIKTAPSRPGEPKNPLEPQTTSKIDYDRFNNYMQCFGNTNDDFGEL